MNNLKSNLPQYFNAVLVNGDEFPRQGSGLYRPTEASAVVLTTYGPEVYGKCARATWYRLHGTPRDEREPLSNQQWRMRVGKSVEDAVIEVLRNNGLFVTRNFQFKYEVSGIVISGEMDAVARTEPCGGQRYCLEVKSGYSYNFQKEVFGKYLNKGQEDGSPRDSYIMQIALYLYYFSRLPKDHPLYLPFGALHVSDRGDGYWGVFDIWLEEVTRFVGEGETVKQTQIWYSSDHMGVKPTLVRYTVEDIIKRYVYISSFKDGPPPRDFKKDWDKTEIEARYTAGAISKSAYEKWAKSHGPRGHKKERLGAWQCYPMYCEYRNTCYPDDPCVYVSNEDELNE